MRCTPVLHTGGANPLIRLCVTLHKQGAGVTSFMLLGKLRVHPICVIQLATGQLSPGETPSFHRTVYQSWQMLGCMPCASMAAVATRWNQRTMPFVTQMHDRAYPSPALLQRPHRGQTAPGQVVVAPAGQAERWLGAGAAGASQRLVG